jgi:hypothetical protein
VEDCSLLTNLAEMVVRELESTKADDRRNFGDQNAAPQDTLRAQDAWASGLLIVQIGTNQFYFNLNLNPTLWQCHRGQLYVIVF